MMFGKLIESKTWGKLRFQHHEIWYEHHATKGHTTLVISNILPHIIPTWQLCSEVLRWKQGHAIAQAVSRCLPTAAARVHVRAACGVHGGRSGTGAGFVRVLRFPLPIIPPISPSS
jgi:hypothetical protein